MPPRAALTMCTVGLTMRSCSSPMSPTVSGVLGRWTVMKSLSRSSSSSETRRTPIWAARAGGDVGVVGDDVHAERGQPLRDQHADAAEADDADGLLVQLDAGVLGCASTRRCFSDGVRPGCAARSRAAARPRARRR